eukprot:jgi/Picsp_1/5879/NSC_03236-R1_elmo domain-containing protein a
MESLRHRGRSQGDIKSNCIEKDRGRGGSQEDIDSCMSQDLEKDSEGSSRTGLIRWARIVFRKIQCIIDDLIDWFYWKLVKCRHLLLHRGSSQGATQPLLLAQRARDFQEQIQVPFQIELEEHHAILRKFWDLALENENYPKDRKSEKWKDLGFQSDDPVRDFRGGGLYSLQCLVYFAQERPDEFFWLMKKSDGVRSQWEYPFAAAGIALTSNLIDAMDVRSISTTDLNNLSPSAAGFMKLLAVDDMAFQQIFVESFLLLDRIWLHESASYMDFPSVISRLCSHVQKIVGKRWFYQPLQISQHFDFGL